MGRPARAADAPERKVTPMRFTDPEREVLEGRAKKSKAELKKIGLYPGDKPKLGSIGMAATRMVLDRPHLITQLKDYVGPGEVMLNK
jgi:hypothetical protein